MPAATLGPSPGAAKHPGHTIVIRRAGRSWTASAGGRLLARSDDALILEETGYEPVLYFPPADISREQLAASATRTRCPFKGEARYYSLDGHDVAWYYPEVYDEVADVAGYVAFYADRVDLRPAAS